MLVSFLIHEDITRRIFVQILIRTMLHAHVIEFETNLEGALQYAAVGNVLQFGVHHRVALAWFAMLKVDTSPNTTIHSDACSNLDFL